MSGSARQGEACAQPSPSIRPRLGPRLGRPAQLAASLAMASLRDSAALADGSKSCRMCAANTTRSATCPTQTVSSLHDCVQCPATDLSAAQISVKLTPALPSAAPDPCSTDQRHGPAATAHARPATLARTRRLSLGSPPCAQQTRTAPWLLGSLARSSSERTPARNPGSPVGQVGVGPDASDTGTMRTSCRHITQRAFGSQLRSCRHVS